MPTSPCQAPRRPRGRRTPVPLFNCSIEVDEPAGREGLVSDLRRRAGGGGLVLDTCQRLEWFGCQPPPLPSHCVTRTASGADAFERLARIAAGLESRVLGELEILGQVRDAYRRFRELGGADETTLDRVFQDALALARKARRESRIDRTMTSLATIAAREILARMPAAAPLAVLGSGSLATSVVRRLAKHGGAPVRVAGRCPENALRLAAEVGGFAGGLDALASMLEGVSGIVCATAAPHPVLYARHLASAARPLTIIDLGVPPDCASDVHGLDGVVYLSLGEIEARASVNLDERHRRAAVAAHLIAEGARTWARGH